MPPLSKQWVHIGLYVGWTQEVRRLKAFSGVTPGAFVAASAIEGGAGRPRLGQLERLRQAWNELLGDRVFVLPSTAGAAPRLWAAPHAVDAHRRATMRLTCLAGITGRPAVSAPLLQVPEGPLGVCLVGPPGSDLALIELAGGLEG